MWVALPPDDPPFKGNPSWETDFSNPGEVIGSGQAHHGNQEQFISLHPHTHRISLIINYGPGKWSLEIQTKPLQNAAWKHTPLKNKNT